MYDKIVIGAGLYGLYAALFCGRRGQRVLVLECDGEPFGRATYANQARVHQGYHYPRSLSTASRSAGYFERFNRDYAFCINKAYQKIYATSARYSWTDAEQFMGFCRAAGIPCEELAPSRYFKPGMCDGAFLTREYTYDASLLKAYFTEKIGLLPNVTVLYGRRIRAIERGGDRYTVVTEEGERYDAGFLLNTTYASANQILALLGYEPFKIKYELCEIILCDCSDRLRDYGFTVMDGPFFSIMPFGRTGVHSLTAVSFTPHSTCYESLPRFSCQAGNERFCSPSHLGNCRDCPNRPETAFPFMAGPARKYLRDEYQFSYRSSLFSMKPILKSSEIDDSRPTVIKVHSREPGCVSVLSGKINTVYDLDEVLAE